MFHVKISSRVSLTITKVRTLISTTRGKDHFFFTASTLSLFFNRTCLYLFSLLLMFFSLFSCFVLNNFYSCFLLPSSYHPPSLPNTANIHSYPVYFHLPTHGSPTQRVCQKHLLGGAGRRLIPFLADRVIFAKSSRNKTCFSAFLFVLVQYVNTISFLFSFVSLLLPFV